MQDVWFATGTSPWGQAWQLPSFVTSSESHARQTVRALWGTCPTGQAWQLPSNDISWDLQAVQYVWPVSGTSPGGQTLHLPFFVISSKRQAMQTFRVALCGTSPVRHFWHLPLNAISFGSQAVQIVVVTSGTLPMGQTSQSPAFVISSMLHVMHEVLLVPGTSPGGHS